MDFINCLSRAPHRTAGKIAKVDNPDGFQEGDLVEQIVRAYRRAVAHPVGDDNSFWLREISDRKRSIHDVYMAGDFDRAGKILRDPRSNNLAYGFDDTTVSRADDPGWEDWLRMWIYDSLLRIAEAVGTHHIESPEAPEELRQASPNVEDILGGLDSAFGFRILFPNPFRGEVGLETSRGVAGYRAVQALFQAWRIFNLVECNREASVLEIGAGFGRAAYYTRRFGLKSYTIIDLPMTNTAQASLLSRALGKDAINLYGDSESKTGKISIFPPAAFFEGKEKYDLIVNIDSLTEMSENTALAYCAEIRNRTSLFLSINHEVNPLTVRQIISTWDDAHMSRTPYWLRAGYVEEIARLRSHRQDGI
jgi:hypothetical protein